MIQACKDKQLTEAYTLTKSGYVYRTKKAKGEIIDSWYVVTTEKTYND